MSKNDPFGFDISAAKDKKRKTKGRRGMSGTGLIWHGGAITPTGVQLVASVEISADQRRRAHLGSLLCLCKLMRRT